MAKPTRSDDWGFPRWRPYGAKSRAATKVRLCDREGCNEPGDRPAPKAPNSRERWMFCEAHAAEYNKNWNYFAGLTAEEAAKRAAEGEQGAILCIALACGRRCCFETQCLVDHSVFQRQSVDGRAADVTADVARCDRSA